MDRHSALVGEKDASKQAEQVLANLASILTAANSGLARTIKLNIYLARPEAMPAAQQVLARQFNGALKPAVSFVVGELPRPDALVAMDAVAAAEGSTAEPGVKRVTVASVYLERGVQHAVVLPAGPKIYVSGMAGWG